MNKDALEFQQELDDINDASNAIHGDEAHGAEVVDEQTTSKKNSLRARSA
jgi:hypothetical protein